MLNLTWNLLANLNLLFQSCYFYNFTTNSSFRIPHGMQWAIVTLTVESKSVMNKKSLILLYQNYND